MKVLVISHWYYSEIAAVFVHQQVKALEREGCEARVVSPTPWTPKALRGLLGRRSVWAVLPAKTVCDGVEVSYPRYLEFPRSLSLATSGKRMYLGIRSAVDSLSDDFDFDVIHAHVAVPDGFAGMMLKREYKKPLVVTCHGGELYQAGQRGGAYRRALTRVFEEADRVVTVSTKLEEIAQPFVKVREKLVVVSNGVAPEEVASPSPDLLARYVGCRVLLSVSYLIRRKGLDLNLSAVCRLSAKYPNLRYLVVGTGPDLPRLERLTHALGLGSRVEFLGELPHERALEYMAIADVFSLPSWNESFGMVYVESAMQGKPVIACEGEGIEDVFANGESALFVKPGDVDGLVKAIDFLLDNRDRAQEIGERAKKVVLEDYAWERNATRYMGIYADLVGAKSAQ